MSREAQAWSAGADSKTSSTTTASARLPTATHVPQRRGCWTGCGGGRRRLGRGRGGSGMYSGSNSSSASGGTASSRLSTRGRQSQRRRRRRKKLGAGQARARGLGRVQGFNPADRHLERALLSHDLDQLPGRIGGMRFFDEQPARLVVDGLARGPRMAPEPLGRGSECVVVVGGGFTHLRRWRLLPSGRIIGAFGAGKRRVCAQPIA